MSSNSPSQRLVPRSGINAIQPYRAGDGKIVGFDNPIKLASNEGPLGPSPQVMEAIKLPYDEMCRYPDPVCGALCKAIAEEEHLKAEQLLIGSGSEQILHWLGRAYARDGDEVIQPEYGFLVYKIATLSVGATLVTAPEHDLTVDVDAIIEKVTSKTKIVFVANPANPTGTWLPIDILRRLRTLLPAHILLVLDAAYAEYMADVEVYDPGHVLVHEAIKSGQDNVVVTRTFSKIHSLAALRIGWVHGPESVIDVLRRFKDTFNVSEIAQRAAGAAIRDREHIEKARLVNNGERGRIAQFLNQAGFQTATSGANFILVNFGSADAAKEMDLHLRSCGVIVRPVAGYGLANYLRISVGLPDQNDTLIKAMKQKLLLK